MLFEVVGGLSKCLEIGAARPKTRCVCARQARRESGAACRADNRAALALRPTDSGPKIDQLDWTKRLAAAVARSYTSTVDLLQSDWLKFDADESAPLGT
jgi:hypothetical protein